MSDYNYNDLVFNGKNDVPNHFKLEGFNFQMMSELDETTKVMIFKVTKEEKNEKDFKDLLCERVRMCVEYLYRVCIISTSHSYTFTNIESPVFFINYSIIFAEDILRDPKFSMKYSTGIISNNSFGISIPENKFVSEIHRYENPENKGYCRVSYITHIIFINLNNNFMTNLDYRMKFISEIICKYISLEISKYDYSNIISEVITSIKFTHHVIENESSLIFISDIAGYDDITIENADLKNLCIETDESKHIKTDFLNYFYTGFMSSRNELYRIMTLSLRTGVTITSTEGDKYLSNFDLTPIRMQIQRPYTSLKKYNDDIYTVQYYPLYDVLDNVILLDYDQDKSIDERIENNKLVHDLLYKHEAYYICQDHSIQYSDFKLGIKESEYELEYDDESESKAIKYIYHKSSSYNIHCGSHIPYMIVILEDNDFDEFVDSITESNYDLNFNVIYQYNHYVYIGFIASNVDVIKGK